MTDLAQKSCTPCRGGVPPLDADAARRLLANVPGWELLDEARKIQRGYRFTNFKEALAFVDHVGALAEAEDHHPDIAFGYNRCTLRFNTHSVGGISLNDFICAAKVDALQA